MNIEQLDITRLSASEKKKLANYIKFHQNEVFQPIEWQKNFFKKGKDIQQRYLMAANRTGKSYASAFEIACHATGIYPEWWEGFRYDYAPAIWIIGESAEQMAAAGGYQEHLFGQFSDHGTGFIPKKCIKKRYNSQTKHAYKSVEIKHITGRITRIDFKSYSQNQEALMGAGVDLIAIDEEPKNQKIYGQLVTRITSAKENGRIILSATPEQGLSPLVAEFLKEDGPKYEGLINVTIWDAHEKFGGYLTDEDIKRIVDNCPPHEQDMRLRGIPKLGSGAVYPFTQESLEVSPLEEIPSEWLQLVAIDPGFNDATALVWLAQDPESNIIYVTDVWSESGADILVIANKILSKGINYLVYPHDTSSKTLAGGGLSIADQLQSAGITLHWEQFYNPMTHDGKRNNSVEVGLTQIRGMMKIGKLKAYDTLIDFWAQQQTYSYSETSGKPGDTRRNGQHWDIMDSFRYGAVSISQNIGIRGAGTSYQDGYTYDEIPYGN